MTDKLKTIDTIDTSPFKKLVMTIGELPTSFIESMTYYEMLAWFVDYLQNTVIPAVNNNAEATKELQRLFIELKNFVDNYFENLDVQEEINNKLDQMAEDGILQEIITTYIQSNVSWTFNTVNDMKNATNLVNGSFARTLGFHSINDNGGCLYKITDTGTANEMDVITVGDLFAHLVKIGQLNVKQFGAYGDGEHDDTIPIQTAIIYNYHSTLYVPEGTYNITTPLNITSSINIIGDGIYSQLIKQNASAYNESINYNNVPFNFNNYSSIINAVFPTDSNLNYLNIKGIYFSKNEEVTADITGIVAPHLAYSTIENCRFTNCTNSIILGGWNDVVKKCEFFNGTFAILVTTDFNFNNNTITECYAKSCYFNIVNASGGIISNTHVDSVGNPFVFVNCKSVIIDSCSVEIWAKVVNANNSFVSIINSDLEMHNKDRYEAFIIATNGSTIFANNNYIHYEDYATPGEYPSTTNLVSNTGASKIFIDNCKISIPFTFTDYISGSGINKINDYVNSNILDTPSKIKKSVMGNTKVEIGRFTWSYGKSIELKVKGYGSHDYACVYIDANISALNRGSNNRVITIKDNTVSSSNTDPWSASITAEYEADNQLVLYYNQTNTWNLAIEVEVEYNKV